jgi:glycolate oxidase FAD binding subunit
VSTTGVSIDLVRELRAICGEDHVVEPAPRANQNVDNEIAVAPGSADEVAAVLRVANQRRFTIVPVGGCSQAGADSRANVLLHTDRLIEVEHYDPADLTVGIGAGMTVAQLNALVAGGKLMFGCDPAFPELSTVGGVLAAAKHGPLRQGFGGMRDFCIGIRFVTGDGRKAKGGGRVVKNVAGYDLMKLLIGSCGTLAVITSASFKLFPAPRQTRTFLTEFATWQEALKFRDLVVRSPLAPMCLEIVSPRARKMMRPEMTNDAWVICVRAAGSDVVLARYRKELGSAVTAELDSEEEIAMWRALADFPVTEKMKQEARWPSPYKTSLHLSLFAPPAELGSVLQVLEDASDPAVAKAAYIGRCGIGHLLIHFENVDSGPDEFMQAKACRQRVSAQVQFVDDWQDLRELPSMRAVKHALDPNNVLRGR